jgi:hypothetical protein
MEYDIKVKLEQYFLNTNFKVIESQRQEERPIPCILIVAGDATPAFDTAEYTGNYQIPINVVVLSSLDDMTVEEHDNAVQQCIAILRDSVNRNNGLIKGLHYYGLHFGGMSEDNENRRMGMMLSYSAVVNYAPDLKYPSA